MVTFDDPYQTPNATEAIAQPIATSKGAVSVSIVLATLAYSNLTIWLLNSTPTDKSVGQLFFMVSPLFVVWLVSLVLAPRLAFLSGIAAVVAQLLVTAIMLHRLGTIALVLGLNGAIATILVLLTIQCWIGRRHWNTADGQGNTSG